MNTPVSFEIKQLLYDRGWRYKLGLDEPGHRVENSLAEQRWNEGDLVYVDISISDVIMWLYEKHDIWISPIPDVSSGHRLIMRKMSVHLFRYREGLNVQTEILRDEENKEILYFNSPTEAYKAAIEYCLTNLIKAQQ